MSPYATYHLLREPKTTIDNNITQIFASTCSYQIFFPGLAQKYIKSGLKCPLGLVVQVGGNRRCVDLGGGNSNIFYFHPEPWGNDPI